MCFVPKFYHQTILCSEVYFVGGQNRNLWVQSRKDPDLNTHPNQAENRLSLSLVYHS